MLYSDQLAYFTRRYGASRLGRWLARRDARAACRSYALGDAA